MARILETSDAITFTVLVGHLEQAHGDARANFETLKKLSKNGGCDLWVIDGYSEELSGLIRNAKFDLAIDAFFGTGLTRPLSSPFEDIMLDLIEADIPLISVDMPSGLNADSPELIGKQFSPSITVTFTSPKPATVLPPAADICGELIVAGIGSPEELINEQPSQLYLAEKHDAAGWLGKSEFSNSSYKNKRGHALLIAGSRNYTGAAVLAADAAIRSGVGLVTLAVPESSREAVVGRVMPEVMVRGITETEEGSASEKAVDEVKDFLKNVDAIAIGSGLSTNDETSAFVRRMVEERTMPMVIDADGLTALSPFDMQGTDELPLVLTPHEGEFMRLLGTEDKDAIKDRVGAVRDFATKHHVILVLKGERVLIGEPGGKVVVNPTGNSGLGKAGNGDTLSGILIGFIAQAVQMKIDVFETVLAACYISGMAGDVAEKKYGKRVMTASDVRECLVEVFEELGQ